ncbi:hypothetical protein Bca4012_099270 [Brassica carinata]
MGISTNATVEEAMMNLLAQMETWIKIEKGITEENKISSTCMHLPHHGVKENIIFSYLIHKVIRIIAVEGIDSTMMLLNAE